MSCEGRVSDGRQQSTRPVFYSQFEEDKLLFRLFKQKTVGLCVDVGANDGMNDSNSLFFEKIGWTCILVEPNPDLCSQIRGMRSCRLHECAASNREGHIVLYIAEGDERAHGVSTVDVDERRCEFTYKPVTVNSKTLDTILAESQIDRELDFVSIDVEGHELEVLKGFSLEKWSPTILIVEDNTKFQDCTVARYLKGHGYRAFKRTGVNNWYIHQQRMKDYVRFTDMVSYWCIKVKCHLKNVLRKVPLIVKVKNSLMSSRKSL